MTPGRKRKRRRSKRGPAKKKTQETKQAKKGKAKEKKKKQAKKGKAKEKKKKQVKKGKAKEKKKSSGMVASACGLGRYTCAPKTTLQRKQTNKRLIWPRPCILI